MHVFWTGPDPRGRTFLASKDGDAGLVQAMKRGSPGTKGKEPGKSSLAPLRAKGTFEPRGFTVQAKEAAMAGGEQGIGALLDAYLERKIGAGAVQGAGPEQVELLQGRSVDSDATMPLPDAEEADKYRAGSPHRSRVGPEKPALQGKRVAINDDPASPGGPPHGAERGVAPAERGDPNPSTIQRLPYTAKSFLGATLGEKQSLPLKSAYTSLYGGLEAYDKKFPVDKEEKVAVGGILYEEKADILKILKHVFDCAQPFLKVVAKQAKGWGLGAGALTPALVLIEAADSEGDDFAYVDEEPEWTSPGLETRKKKGKEEKEEKAGKEAKAGKEEKAGEEEKVVNEGLGTVKLHADAKALWDAGPPGQGYFGAIDLSTGMVYLLPGYNYRVPPGAKADDEKQWKKPPGVKKFFKITDKETGKTKNVPTYLAEPLGQSSGGGHGALVMNYGLMPKRNDRYLMGFGIFKGEKGDSPNLAKLRNRSAFINVHANIWKEPSKVSLWRKRSMPEMATKGLARSVGSLLKTRVELNVHSQEVLSRADFTKIVTFYWKEHKGAHDQSPNYAVRKEKGKIGEAKRMIEEAEKKKDEKKEEKEMGGQSSEATSPPKEGAAEPKKKNGKCFLTSACVVSRGLPDDCHELQVLRRFRDGYVLNLDGGERLVDEYYRVAPVIVDAIGQSEGSGRILGEIYEVVRECVAMIEDGEESSAMAAYRKMVDDLSKRYGVE